MNLKGRVAVITGGETGIGRATVEALAAHGMQIVIGGILGEAGAETTKAVCQGLTFISRPPGSMFTPDLQSYVARQSVTGG